MSKIIPLVTDVLELYTKTTEGLPLWKTKGKILTFENLLDDIFVTSSDLAEFFNIRHDHLVSQNIAKLQKRGHLPERLPNFREPFITGNLAPKSHIIYALTREQTEHLIMDFSGTRASEKKHVILHRLHAIERDVAKGAYEDARMKIQEWDGVQLLKDLGFQYSLPNQMATKQDLIQSMDVPESTLNAFLRRHSDQIKPVRVDQEAIRSLGIRASRLNAYTAEDVFKIVFWMDSTLGIRLKKKIFGNIGIDAIPVIRYETEWKDFLSKVFAGFGFKTNHKIGKYFVDFFVEKLDLVLECDTDNHESYKREKEEERENFITEKYTLVRFNSKIDVQTLFNGILKAKSKEMIKLYLYEKDLPQTVKL